MTSSFQEARYLLVKETSFFADEVICLHTYRAFFYLLLSAPFANHLSILSSPLVRLQPCTQKNLVSDYFKSRVNNFARLCST
jgi:hypothetical protein